MTRCHHIASLLTEYLSDELGPLERAIVDDHLAECAACRAELALAREVADGLATLPTQPCPDHVSRDIMAVVVAEAAGRPVPGRRGRPDWWRRAGLAGALAAAVLLVLVLPQHAPEPKDMVVNPDSVALRDEAVAAATRDFLWTLAFTASVIDRSEERPLVEMWRQVRSRTPGSHTAIITGGQG